MERTFAMIKPDAVASGHVGHIIARIEEEGFGILAMTKLWLTPKMVADGYAEHVGKPFFEDMSAFLCSGPSVLLVLERGNAVKHWRDVIGPTDPNKALSESRRPLPISKRATLRSLYGDKIGPMFRNAVHGSDLIEAAERESLLFGGQFAPLFGAAQALDTELHRARKKFPGNRFLTAALAEEMGETAEAVAENDGSPGAIDRIKKEALQVACVAIRIYEEGDAILAYQSDGLLSLIIATGRIAKCCLQRDNRGLFFQDARSVLMATVMRLAKGDSTFDDITDEEAKP